MQARADAWRPKWSLGANLGLLGSLLVHIIVYAWLSWAGTMPSVDFELRLPSEVELGLTQTAPPVEPIEAASKPAAVAAAEAVTTPAIPTKPKPIRRKHRAPGDAGLPDASGSASPDAGTARAGGTDAGPALLSAYAPAGAQLALRLHMGRVRDSALADDVRALLDAVPDWRLIVQGSELEPLRDLERLYIASPDLQRASVVIAGQYLGDDDLPRQAVEKLAAARGVQASWRKYGAIPVAPWANADDTKRVVALIAPHQFAITRPDDLPRVLAVARALAQRRAKGGAATVDPGEALLGLEQDEMLAFSVEGARLFAQGRLEGVPTRLQLSVRKRDDAGLDLQLAGEFEDAASADKARLYWERTRDRFASHPLLAFIGMREPLASLQLETQGSSLRFRTLITVQQARVLLGFVHNALEPTAAGPEDRTRGPKPERVQPRTGGVDAQDRAPALSPPNP